MPHRAVSLVVLALACRGDDDPTGPTPGPTGPSSLELRSVSADVHDTVGSILVVSWEQTAPATVHVEFTFEDDVWQRSPDRELDAGAHEELVLGVPYETVVTWRLVATAAGATVSSADDEERTGPAPDGLPVGEVLASDAARWDPAVRFYFTSLNGTGPGSSDYQSLIVDRSGRAVWSVETPRQRITMHPRVAVDGRSLLVDHNSFYGTFDGGRGSSVHRLLVDGSEVESWDTPGLHHAFTDLPDGRLAYGRFTGYYVESLAVVDPDRTIENVWSCDAFLAELDYGGYCGSNTLNYDAASDRFLFSFYSVETIIEIDATTRQATRWFGHLPGSYAFDPPESAFWWQHGGHLTEAGTLLTSTYRVPDGDELVLREYEIDDAARTVRQVWTFGEGEGLWGIYMGEGHRLPGGNTLQNLGTYQRLREVTPDGEVVWDVEWTDVDGEIGRSEPVLDLYALAPPRP